MGEGGAARVFRAVGPAGRDVALIMSNGDFGGIWERLLARLRTAKED